MNKITLLLERIDSAKPLDFGDIFSRSIELFKKVWVQGLVTILIASAIMFPLYMIMYIPLIFLGVLGQEGYAPEDLESVSVIMIIGFVIFFLFFMCFIMVIAFALQAAFFRICKTKDLNEAGSDDYFYFLKKTYLKRTISVAFASLGIQLLAAALCFFPLVYVAVPVSLFGVIYAFNPKLTTSDIIKVAFRLGNKNWFLIFGLSIVSSLLAQIIGFFMCFIGIIATMSFAIIPNYFVYKDAIGFESDDDIIDEIGVVKELE